MPQQWCTGRHHRLVRGIFTIVDQQPTPHMDVVHTFKGRGFTTTCNHISSYQNMCLSNDKNSLQFIIVAAALTWGHTWRQKHIKFYCDNLVIVNSCPVGQLLLQMQVCLLARAVPALLFYCVIAIWLAPLGFPLVCRAISVSAARLSPTLSPERWGLLLGRLLYP